MIWSHTFKTELGWIGLLIEDRQIVALTFGSSSRKEAVQRLKQQAGELGIDGGAAPGTSCQGTFAKECEQRLCEYAAGTVVDLGRIPIRIHARTSFQSRVLQACRAIPHGETLTYQQLAQLAGSPQASRAVGNVMARNRVPLLIPCHRVVASGGKLGGFSAPRGLDMKRQLLDLEQRASSVLV